ncbi:MAG: YlbF family regulator [Clostridia bacterium]|nr:YlbF family regulator [Clostridia bacterium]
MDIIELTRKLGAAIQETEEYKKFMEAKLRNDKDEELQKQIGDFNLLKMQLDAEHEKEPRDEAKVLALNEEIVALYNTIISGEAMSTYNAAYQEYKNLTDKISNILLMCENGEDPETCEPSSCSGNCASCGGCH